MKVWWLFSKVSTAPLWQCLYIQGVVSPETRQSYDLPNLQCLNVSSVVRLPRIRSADITVICSSVDGSVLEDGLGERGSAGNKWPDAWCSIIHIMFLGKLCQLSVKVPFGLHQNGSRQHVTYRLLLPVRGRQKASRSCLFGGEGRGCGHVCTGRFATRNSKQKGKAEMWKRKPTNIRCWRRIYTTVWTRRSVGHGIPE